MGPSATEKRSSAGESVNECGCVIDVSCEPKSIPMKTANNNVQREFTTIIFNLRENSCVCVCVCAVCVCAKFKFSRYFVCVC